MHRFVKDPRIIERLRRGELGDHIDSRYLLRNIAKREMATGQNVLTPVTIIDYAESLTSTTILPTMKRSVIWPVVFLCGCTTFVKDGTTVSSLSDQFFITRHTFIDVGPPNDFYEIISVRGTPTARLLKGSHSLRLVTPVSNDQRLK